MSGLEALGLRVAAGGRALLRDVTLRIDPGETVALLGPNGAGKSTLLRALAGDRPPPGLEVRGEVRLDDRPIGGLRPLELARRRAVLPQSPSMAFGYTALELAALGRHAHGESAGAARAIGRAALRAVDAEHLAAREVPTLSGGERARAHLACALAQLWDAASPGPRYLLLDEPTAALDLAHQFDVLALARGFARGRGIGVIAVLHDPNLAAQYADRVAVLEDGALAGCGPPRDVLRPARVEATFGVRAATLEHPLRDGVLIAVASRAPPPALGEALTPAGG